MQKNKLFHVLCISTGLAVVLRFVQYFLLTDHTTGFYKGQGGIGGLFVYGLFYAALLVPVCFVVLGRKTLSLRGEQSLSKNSIVLTGLYILSAFAAELYCYEVLTASFYRIPLTAENMWLYYVQAGSAALGGLFFLCMAYGSYVGRHGGLFVGLLASTPVLLFCSTAFLRYAGLTAAMYIVEEQLYIAQLGLAMLFFLEHGRHTAAFTVENPAKLPILSGLLAVNSFVLVVPAAVGRLLGTGSMFTIAELFLFLLLGVYALYLFKQAVPTCPKQN